MKNGTRVAALAAALSLATAAFAHHAWTDIDTTRTVTLTGSVNPHASLVLEADDNGTKSDWTVLMSPIPQMQAHGIAKDSVAVGHVLTIVASPSLDGAHRARANRIRGSGKEFVLYGP